MTWQNRGAVAENVGFIAYSSDLSNPVPIGTIQSQSCYDVLTESNNSHGPEHEAFAEFTAKLKEQRVRYVENIRSEHEDQTIFIPFLGGTSRCVKFYGKAYQ